MKKQWLYLSLLATASFLVSCENESSLDSMDVEAGMFSTVASLEKDYNFSLNENPTDFVLKGYKLPEGDKDELTPTSQEETKASDDIINYMKAKVEKEKNESYSKIRIAEPTRFYMGVFKVSTCGGHEEFIYFMDCEDGGWTNIENPKNLPFATKVDKNKNIEFHMCVVDNHSEIKGYALSLSDIPNYLLRGVSIIERFHDNEDHSNKNNIVKAPNGVTGRAILGGTIIDNNSLLSWINPGPYIPTMKIGWPHGVIAANGDITINIDDENKSSLDWVRYCYNIESAPFPWSTDFPKEKWEQGFYCWENTAYSVKIYNE